VCSVCIFLIEIYCSFLVQHVFVVYEDVCVFMYDMCMNTYVYIYIYIYIYIYTILFIYTHVCTSTSEEPVA
jgi:hypothetical protein